MPDSELTSEKFKYRRYEYLGEVGKGTSMKLAINLPLLVYWQALGEALSIAPKSGIEFEKAIIFFSLRDNSVLVKTRFVVFFMTNELEIKSLFSSISSIHPILIP